MPRLVREIRNVRLQLECPGAYNSDKLDDVRGHFASQWANPPEDVDRLVSADALSSIKAQALRSLGVADAGQVPFAIILVEGILLFHDGDQSSDHHPGSVCDTGVFIYAQYDTLKTRRESRTAYATVEGVWADPPGYFDALRTEYVLCNCDIVSLVFIYGDWEHASLVAIVVLDPEFLKVFLSKKKILKESSELPHHQMLRVDTVVKDAVMNELNSHGIKRNLSY
ncbi:ribosylnicotinamide kinase [Coemansia sp. S16]|nr:ribosylnicotinamide kinase [Coemansia sp. S16]